MKTPRGVAMAEVVLASALLAGLWWSVNTAWRQARERQHEALQVQQVLALGRDSLACLRARATGCLDLPRPAGLAVSLSLATWTLAPHLDNWVLTAQWTLPSGEVATQQWQAWVSAVPDGLDVSLPP